ncbi:hypothetical protein GQ457_02G028950 [Hibiscus cannabinus]
MWGNVIKVEDETSTKARLDVARVLVGVSSLSDIPSCVPISVNGKLCWIRVTMSEFEDDRAWIDVESPIDDPDEDSRSLCNETQDAFNAEPPRNIVGEGEQLFHDELLDPRGEDPNECAGEQELRVCSNINTEIRDQTHFDIEPDIHPGLLSDGDLLDIPVNQMVEPTRASSDISASETPSFDSGSSLFTVKPKLLKLSNGVHPLTFRSKVDRPQSWAGSFAFASQGRTRTGVSSGSRKNRSYKSRGLSPHLLRLRDTSSCPQSSKLVRNDIDDDLLEARKSVEVCKGLGRREKKAAVRNLFLAYKPRVPFLQESKLQSVEGKLVRYLCGGASDFSFVHSPSEGSSGGIISLWDQNYFGLESSTIHKSYIVLLGSIIPLQFKCALVNIYAPNDNAERLSVFSELRSTLSQLSVPLLLGGDFNIVRTLDEKKGVTVNRSAMATFSNFIENLFLMDPPLQGGAFTWSNLREFPSLGRLDRFLISPDLLLKWPNAIQRLLPKSLSDHNPIAISCCDPNWGPKPFKWFDHWGDDKDIHGIILKKCKEMTGKGIGQTLKSCKFATKQWVQANKYRDLASTSTLEQQQLKLEAELHSGGVLQSKVRELSNVREKFWAQYRMKEQEWIQKSRVKWFQVGDRNSRFFHMVASSRRRVNTIHTLNVVNKVLDKPVAIKDVMFEHFKKIYNAHPTGIGSLSGYLSLSLREAPPPCRLREVYPPGSKSLVLAGPDDGSGLDSKRISITVILGHPGLLNQYRLLTRNKAGEIDDRLANIEKAFEDTKSDIEKKMERAQQSTQDYIAQSQADFLAKKTFWSQEDFNHGVVGASEPIKSTKRKKWAILTPIRRLIPSYYVSSGNRKV